MATYRDQTFDTEKGWDPSEFCVQSGDVFDHCFFEARGRPIPKAIVNLSPTSDEVYGVTFRDCFWWGFTDAAIDIQPSPCGHTNRWAVINGAFASCHIGVRAVRAGDLLITGREFDLCDTAIYLDGCQHPLIDFVHFERNRQNIYLSATVYGAVIRDCNYISAPLLSGPGVANAKVVRPWDWVSMQRK